MTDKGIVLKISPFYAEIQLEKAPGVKLNTPQLFLKTLSFPGISEGNTVLVELSPPHPIRAKPWDLMASIAIFTVCAFFHQLFLGFGGSLLILVLSFFKKGQIKKSYEPKIISILKK